MYIHLMKPYKYISAKAVQSKLQKILSHINYIVIYTIWTMFYLCIMTQGIIRLLFEYFYYKFKQNSIYMQCIQDHLNSIEPSICFSLEVESDNHTDRYLSFASHHPLAHKASVVCTLFTRARSICSSVGSHKSEEQHIYRALR